jgi:inosine/xanthosine triphosphatase
MRVVVGSLNPVKLEAVRLALTELWPKQKHKIDGISASSGIAKQPLSDQQMLKGASQRAQQALTAAAGADIGIGLEGGLHKTGKNWFGRSWMVAIDKSGQRGIGSSVSCLIPPDMMELVQQGKDMSQVCEQLYGIKDIGQKAGYFGLLTGNAITRSSGYRDGVIMALTRWRDLTSA